jgi:hypothetical protein
MTATKWLEQHAPGFQALSLEAREAIMHFSFLWSLFESEALNRHGNANALVAIAHRWADAGLLNADSFEPQLAYFGNRYYRDGEFTDHFRHLNLPEGNYYDLVSRVLMNEAAERSEIAAAMLIIVYRFRNNLFHGEKWLYQIHGQLENFNHANTILMQAIELHRQLPRQQ